VLARSGLLSVPRPASLPVGAQVVVVRLEDIQGTRRLVLVARPKAVGDRLVLDPVLPTNGTVFEGLRTGGRYLFVRVTVPFGFAAGQVLGVTDAPLAGALVTTDRLVLAAL